MAKLSRETIQRLAVLRALTLWRRGPYGPVRLQKTMFRADQNNRQQKRLFTFKKYYLGQYSQQIAEGLNALRAGGRLQCLFDGPAERLEPVVSTKTKTMIREFFELAFPQWEEDLKKVFPEWGYLSNDKILKKAHDDPTYKESQHDEVIFECTLPDKVNIPDLGPDTAEHLTDLVDERLISAIRTRLVQAVKIPTAGSDWRRLYFGKDAV